MTMTVVPVILHVPLNFVVYMVFALLGAYYFGNYLLLYFRCQLCFLLYVVLVS